MPDSPHPGPKPSAPPRLLPGDEHDEALAANVHPPGWKNPEPEGRYNLVVVGGGTAGLVSAAGAALLGAKAALVERDFLGGDCLVHGCVPSKAVIRAARAWHERLRETPFGAPKATTSGDFAQAMEHMRRVRAKISAHDSARRFHDLGVDVFLGEGRFVAGDAVEVGDERLVFSRAVVATGAGPAKPPIPGLEEVEVLTNETIFSLTELPESLVVVGGGPIGCELAQSFARFGSRVTVVDMADRILPKDEEDAAEIVQGSLERDGVTFELGAKVSRFEPAAGGTRVVFEREGEESSVTGERILLAVGRAPNVEGLGLEAAGVEYSRKGVQVDDRLRTSNRRIFAAGDVASPLQFTHTADAQARIVLRNALFPLGFSKNSNLVVPWATYTSPEVAHVGLTAEEAKKKGKAVETITVPLEGNDRAITDDATEGFLRLYLKAGKGKILGATLVADHASEMINELTLAITHGLSLSKIATTIHPYPTQAEVIRKAADEWNRRRLTMGKKGLLEAYFRWRR